MSKEIQNGGLTMKAMIPLSKLTEIAKLFRGDAGLKIKVIDDDVVVVHNNKYKIVVVEKTIGKNGTSACGRSYKG